MEWSGHAARPGDLDRFAELGVRTMRYPILWERTAPDGLASADWRWADERLGRLRSLGIRPIVGLLHHGSGPRDTGLLDPELPEKLAAFARAVAERYPWIDAYTPVNEPLTTARFSALYGHWYPHAKDGLLFARALLLQCRAVALAMRAVREVNPAAILVQTEDLGETKSTPLLSYQADFENERRWLTYDLLVGRVDRHHSMWRHLRWVGVPEAELDGLLERPCPPDVIGINHYVTSERFLDERLDRYPPITHGGNGRHAYADVEVVRACEEGLVGPRSLLRQAWRRYRTPCAITEAHMGCTREEQMRWLMEVWRAAEGARQEGADVRAVTIWALLGSFDWDSLVTRPSGRYEPGVFDVRGPLPRRTALAGLVADLSARRVPEHPVLGTPGWWRRPRSAAGAGGARVTGASRPILVTGATGTLGRAFARVCGGRGLASHLTGRGEMDIADPGSVAQALDRIAPWAVVNTAGYVRVDDAEREITACRRENADGPGVLAAACARRGIALVTFSSDLVFDGKKAAPYEETDPPAPLNAYGRSKAEGEARVLEAHAAALVVRTSAFFGPWDEHNFVTVALARLAAGEPLAAAEDAVVSPTYVPDLAHACLDLLIDGESGVWHLASGGALPWADLARMAATIAGIDGARVEGVPTLSLGLAARRPLYSALCSARGALMPPLEDALRRYRHDRETYVRERAPEACAPPGPAGRT